ncbi:MAG: hypothetical protein AABW58_01100 [Nanoarchaeota archaeon]
MQETAQEGHVTSKNLVDILETEGFVKGVGQIAKDPYLVQEGARDAYPQDVIDTIREIVKLGIMQEGLRFLMSSQARMVSYLLER